jgi:hypothetical protein
LNGRVARYGWRSDINRGRESKRREHSRVRQMEAQEWQEEAWEDIWEFFQ